MHHVDNLKIQQTNQNASVRRVLQCKCLARSSRWKHPRCSRSRPAACKLVHDTAGFLLRTRWMLCVLFAKIQVRFSPRWFVKLRTHLGLCSVRMYGCPELNFGINLPILRKHPNSTPFTFIVSNKSMADAGAWDGSGSSPAYFRVLSFVC